MENSKKSWLSLGAIGIFLLGKLKWLLVILKLAKLGSFLSIFISLGAYAFVYGWKFAVALVYLLYVHEMGHLLAAKKKGIKTSNAIFIPFVGALISLKEEPKNANDEAYLAFAGPLLGTLAFLPAIPLFFLTESPFWLLVINLGSMINLFNLMPVHPLDGGRIVGVISTKLWIVGIIGMTVYMFFHPNVILILFLLLGISKWWGECRNEITRSKRASVIEINRFGLQQLEHYLSVPEDEKIHLTNIWRFELDGLTAKLNHSKKWYIPFKDDGKLIEKHLIELKSKVYIMLLDGGMLQNDEAYEQTLSSFRSEIKEHDQKMKIEKVYYVSSNKTKLKWFCLYIGLAIFLMVAMMYFGDLLGQKTV